MSTGPAAAVVAVIAAAIAAGLLLAPGRLRATDPHRPAGGSAPSGTAVVASVVGVAGVVVLIGGRIVLVPAVLTAVLGVVVVRWRRGRRREHAVARRREEVRSWCEQLAGDLAAGRPPVLALDDAAREWPLIAPVARAAAVGADVPNAWRAVALTAGAERLGVVAAAWQVAGHSGAGLASTLDDLARSLRADDATRRLVEGELASARATGRLVAALAPLALLLGQGLGGDPWGLLLTTPLGLGCLGIGGGLLLLGLGWIERLARDAVG